MLKRVPVLGLFLSLTYALPFTCTWQRAEEITPKEYGRIVEAFKVKYSMHYDGSGVVLAKKKTGEGYELLIQVVPECKNATSTIVCKFLPPCIKLEVSKRVYDFAAPVPPECNKMGPKKWVCTSYSEIVTRDKAVEGNCIPMEYRIGNKTIKTAKIQLCSW